MFIRRIYGHAMRSGSRCLAYVVPLLLVGGGCASADGDTNGGEATVRHLDSMTVPDGSMPFGVPFGGISGIDYDPTSGRYIAISDDRAEKGPARYFELGLPIDDSGRFTAEQPDILTMTALANSDGQPYPAKDVDPESARRDPDSGNILYSSEGDASKFLAPFVRAASAAGAVVEDYPLRPRISRSQVLTVRRSPASVSTCRWKDSPFQPTALG